MALTVREVAELVRGEVVGDGDGIIRAARPLLEARLGDITFVEDPKYLDSFHESGATAAVVSLSIPMNGHTLVRVPDPRAAFFTIHETLHPRPLSSFVGTHPTANIHPLARIAPDASIGAGVSVGEGSVVGARCQLYPGVIVGRGCRIGEDVVLHPHVVLYDGCMLGNRIIIHANSVIGADGFGYKLTAGRHAKVAQIGQVVIDDDVEIGACSTIDRATFGTTHIGAGTKIDNLVQVGHNCQIGRHNILCSQVGIAGSVTTGDFVVMAGQVGVCDHLRIGAGVQIGPQAGITKDVPADTQMWGSPAITYRERLREIMMLEKLPNIRKDIKKIKQSLNIADESHD